MKRNSAGKRGLTDSAPHNGGAPDKVGWIRKFCGKGIFREIWKNRFVVLRGEQLFVCEKEGKELGGADEVLDLLDYERCEEFRKNKSRSKKNHSKFRLQRCSSPGNTVPNLVFLAISPEDKESWILVLNAAITRAKNRILDEVTVEDSQLCHLTRDRAKIPHNRRLPSRGHLLAVASASSPDGTLTLDLIQEEDGCSRVVLDEAASHLGPDRPRPPASSEAAAKTQSLPRQVTALPHQLPTVEKNRCASMDQIQTNSETKAAPKEGSAAAAPVHCLRELIDQRLRETERLLMKVRAEAEEEEERATDTAGVRVEAERLLKEAAATWIQAQQVLEEVKQLRVLYQQLDSSVSPSNCPKRRLM